LKVKSTSLWGWLGLIALAVMVAINDALLLYAIIAVILFILGRFTLRTLKIRRLFICPYCYARHRFSECVFKCSFDSNRAGNSECEHGVRKSWDGKVPQNLKYRCVGCKHTTMQVFCSVYTEKEVPLEFMHMTNFPIALLGAKATGKSNYIGVLIQEIINTMCYPFHCTLSMSCSKESAEAYDTYYYRPLYQEGRTIQATDAGVQIPALISSLQFKHNTVSKLRQTLLTFYDTAGENLSDKQSMYLFNGYISYAQGIILLLDPLQVPFIREQLTAKGFTGLPEQNTDTAYVLDAVIQVIRGINKVKGRINIPLALVFTKIDVLEQYDILPANSCLRQESEHLGLGKFVMTDFEDTQLQMEALIDNWVEGTLMSYIKQFRHYAFFGVTALGANPVGNTLSAKVNPRRVLDPLLWLLAKERYIATVR